MNKRQLHHYWRKIKLIKPWYLFALAGCFGVLSIYGLRSNNERMATLRAEVYAADRNNGDVSGALNKLRGHVYAHMNTDLATPNGVYPPIQLKYTYERLVQTETARAASVNSQIYTQAQAYCEQQNPVDFSGRNRVPCIDNYVKAHGVKTQSIPDALYKFNFASPTWSPDLAGWSIVLTALSLLLGIGLILFRRWVTK